MTLKVMTSERGEFSHQESCKLLKADPSFSPEWQEVERGFWKAECQCGVEIFRDVAADDRVRRDPSIRRPAATLGSANTSPSRSRHAQGATEGQARPGPRLRLGACAAGWQVPHYAESVG
jgi:hypothetical protein